MDQTTANCSSEPLYPSDLAVCQRVFDHVRANAGFSKTSEEAERIAAVTMELYRHGVQDAADLEVMVQAARGLLQKGSPLAA